MAYAAIQNRLPLECWLLLAANVFYAFAYDTEYAMVDRDDDARLGVRSSALTLGRWDVAAVMASYGAMLAILLARGRAAVACRWPYYAGLAAARRDDGSPLAPDPRPQLARAAGVLF